MPIKFELGTPLGDRFDTRTSQTVLERRIEEFQHRNPSFIKEVTELKEEILGSQEAKKYSNPYDAAYFQIGQILGLNEEESLSDGTKIYMSSDIEDPFSDEFKGASNLVKKAKSALKEDKRNPDLNRMVVENLLRKDKLGNFDEASGLFKYIVNEECELDLIEGFYLTSRDASMAALYYSRVYNRNESPAARLEIAEDSEESSYKLYISSLVDQSVLTKPDIMEIFSALERTARWSDETDDLIGDLVDISREELSLVDLMDIHANLIKRGASNRSINQVSMVISRGISPYLETELGLDKFDLEVSSISDGILLLNFPKNLGSKISFDSVEGSVVEEEIMQSLKEVRGFDMINLNPEKAKDDNMRLAISLNKTLAVSDVSAQRVFKNNSRESEHVH